MNIYIMEQTIKKPDAFSEIDLFMTDRGVVVISLIDYYKRKSEVLNGVKSFIQLAYPPAFSERKRAADMSGPELLMKMNDETLPPQTRRYYKNILYDLIKNTEILLKKNKDSEYERMDLENGAVFMDVEVKRVLEEYRNKMKIE